MCNPSSWKGPSFPSPCPGIQRRIVLMLREATAVIVATGRPKRRRILFRLAQSRNFFTGTSRVIRVYIVSNRGEVNGYAGMANGNDGPFQDEGLHMTPPSERKQGNLEGREPGCGYHLVIRPDFRRWHLVARRSSQLHPPSWRLSLSQFGHRCGQHAQENQNTRCAQSGGARKEFRTFGRSRLRTYGAEYFSFHLVRAVTRRGEDEAAPLLRWRKWGCVCF